MSAPIYRVDALDGETGAVLFRAPLDVMRDCSAQGSCDAAVADALDSEELDESGKPIGPTVQWVAELDELRAFLRRCGGWDPEELAAESERTIRERALWVGAGDFRENVRERIRELRHDKKLGGPGLDSYVFNAGTLCESCGENRIDKIAREAERTLDIGPLESEDSDDCPVPSFFTETDSPQSCDDCRAFVSTELTSHGARYVAEAIRDYLCDGAGNREFLAECVAAWFRGELEPRAPETRRAILRALARVRRRYRAERAAAPNGSDLGLPVFLRLDASASALRSAWIQSTYSGDDVRELLRGPGPKYRKERS